MLTIRIYSFSYTYGEIPEDETENGGGFVFDCRFIDNPGRKTEFNSLTGKDKAVKDYIGSLPLTRIFLKNLFEITDSVITEYQKRGFTDVMFSFGCTGGQHRSVYFAERAAEYISSKYPNAEVVVTHTMI